MATSASAIAALAWAGENPWSWLRRWYDSKEAMTSAVASDRVAASGPMAANSGANSSPICDRRKARFRRQLGGQQRLERRPQPRDGGGVADHVEEAEPLVDEGGDLRRQWCVGTAASIGTSGMARPPLAVDGDPDEIVDVVEVPEERAGRESRPGGDLLGARG